ncbi:hypothetical protein ACJJTC_017283 [Scirpophaga incertulas]
MSSLENDGEIIQYAPFISFVHPSFWHSLTEMKLDIDKLSENTKQIYGRFTYRDDLGPIFEVDGASFNSSPYNEQYYQNVIGKLMNKNTIEDFKTIDKAALLNSIGSILWAEVKKKTWISNPSFLLNFFVLSYADLKKFHYYYWFAFPAPSQPTIYLREKSKSITTHFNNELLENLAESFKLLDVDQKCFFAVIKKNDNVTIKHLSSILGTEESKIDFTNTYFAFADSSNSSNPAWSLRFFLAALFDHCPRFSSKDITIIGLRCSSNGAIGNSVIYTIQATQTLNPVESAGWVGWERNDKGNFGPKLANMLADTSSDLNIKLMKWRLVPEIDVDVMKITKCLLLGAGTLGCHVARNLMAWGFRHITFIDNGKVSYSNPTRQVLFSFKDCLNGGRKKAEAAAENLKLILPTIKSQGVAAHIPMPGHPIGESMHEETLANIQIITNAIMQHDVIFLLLDTREARWLPTLLAAASGKITINAALGFDSYLVMRHGISMANVDTEMQLNTVVVPGTQLGCYFCSDVTAPGNSLRDRTLDQQCTVTRPGVAAVAGALAVEMLVALLQHPKGIDAPSIYNPTDNAECELVPETQSILGAVPHSIRGFLHSHQTVLPTCTKFKQCIACSTVVVNKYKQDGIEFLFKVFNSGTYLEEITGLSELHLAAEMTDMLALSDDEE